MINLMETLFSMNLIFSAFVMHSCAHEQCKSVKLLGMCAHMQTYGFGCELCAYIHKWIQILWKVVSLCHPTMPFFKELFVGFC